MKRSCKPYTRSKRSFFPYRADAFDTTVSGVGGSGNHYPPSASDLDTQNIHAKLRGLRRGRRLYRIENHDLHRASVWSPCEKSNTVRGALTTNRASRLFYEASVSSRLTVQVAGTSPLYVSDPSRPNVMERGAERNTPSHITPSE